MIVEAFCPAKVNLFLEVLARRPDGYHNIATLFQTIDLGDRLTVQLSENYRLTGAEGMGDPSKNLITRAVNAFRKQYHIEENLSVHLEKIIPAGAGLGGGSSDAAGALLICRRLWRPQLLLGDLLPLAAGLGADVPFFLQGGSQYATGIGEILEPAPAPYPFWVVVATPHCHSDTAAAYRAIEPRQSSGFNGFKQQYAQNAQDPLFYKNLKNDFEEPVLELFPEIKELFVRISTHNPVKAMLSGSGSSLFALFAKSEEAEVCLQAIESRCRFAGIGRFTGSQSVEKRPLS